MSKIIYLFVCLSFVKQGYGQITQQPEYTSYLKAKNVLDRARRYSGLMSDSLAITVSSVGIIHESGHFSMPEERVDMPEIYTLRLFAGPTNYFLDGELKYRGQIYTRQLYVKQDSIFFRDYFDRAVSRTDLNQRIGLYDEVLTLHPVLLLNAVLKKMPSLRYVGKDGKADLISFNTNQTIFTLRVLPDGQLEQASYLANHSYFGDNVHRYKYLDYKTVADYKLPSQFKEYEFDALRKEQKFTYDVNEPLVLPSNQVCPNCQLLPKEKTEQELTVKELGGGLYAVELHLHNNRSLFLVGDKGVTVFEAPLSDDTGRRIIEAVKRTTGGKPITQVFVTHHHPDHAGGLRPFVEQGAVIITTKGNVDFLGRLVNYPHRLDGKSTTKLLKPSFLVVDSLQTFKAGNSEPFAVYNIGDTQHTKEYLLAYFPKQKILFHGDLCFFRQGVESAASVREQAVGRLICHYKLDVEKIYGSWPLKGLKEFGTKAELNRKLELATK